ncbi:MAG: hypothetical protein IPG60_15665 [Bacteroidetes bacterium]|nr:hypothetical protein [Bacteroidota bacterium]MBP9549411.1 hypothetical protein [Chitinophagales bacterium]
MIDYLNTSTSITATSPSCARETMRERRMNIIDVSSLITGMYIITVLDDNSIKLTDKLFIIK